MIIIHNITQIGMIVFQMRSQGIEFLNLLLSSIVYWENIAFHVKEKHIKSI